MNEYNLVFTKNKLNSYSLESDKITISFQSEEQAVGALMDFDEIYPEIISDSSFIYDYDCPIFLDFKRDNNLTEYKIEDLEKYKVV
jgi:hypothetical protein